MTTATTQQRLSIVPLAYHWGIEDGITGKDNEASQFFAVTDKRWALYVAGFVAGCLTIGRFNAAIAAQSTLHGGKHVETYQTLQAAGA